VHTVSARCVQIKDENTSHPVQHLPRSKIFVEPLDIDGEQVAYLRVSVCDVSERVGPRYIHAQSCTTIKNRQH